MKNIKLEDFGAELLKLAEEAITGIETGINEAVEDLAAKSQQLAPLDEGGLMENASVEPATNDGKEIKSSVGYNKEYALKMHEDIYTAKVSGKGRKYLEKPLTENSDKYVEHIAKKMSGDA